jgi:hypothetical protein
MIQSSPVNSIEDLVLWLETTSEASFDSAVDDGTSITSPYIWNDINGQTSQKSSASGPAGPNYIASCIESLPCLRFNGTSQYLNITQKNGMASQISVFAVVKINTLIPSPAIMSIFSSTVTKIAANNYFETYLSYGGTYPQVGFGSPSTSMGGLATIPVNKAVLYEAIDTGTALNIATSAGGLSITRLSNPVVTSSKNLDSGLSIGAYFNGTTRNQYFNGDIAEIIVFDRALKNQERDDVEKYLSKKWGFKI